MLALVGTLTLLAAAPTFMADDAAIPVGIRTMSLVLLDYLQRESHR